MQNPGSQNSENLEKYKSNCESLSWRTNTITALVFSNITMCSTCRAVRCKKINTLESCAAQHSSLSPSGWERIMAADIPLQSAPLLINRSTRYLLLRQRLFFRRFQASFIARKGSYGGANVQRSLLVPPKRHSDSCCYAVIATSATNMVRVCQSPPRARLPATNHTRGTMGEHRHATLRLYVDDIRSGHDRLATNRGLARTHF